jgi:hypothetical protein
METINQNFYLVQLPSNLQHLEIDVIDIFDGYKTIAGIVVSRDPSNWLAERDVNTFKCVHKCTISFI